MTEKSLNTRIVNKHDIEANWLKAVNFIPRLGETIIYDPDGAYDYPRIKIGDGVHNVNDLTFETPIISNEELDNILNVHSVSAREVKF